MHMEHSSACILFFVRYPVAGMVKTRLAKDIGHERAASLYGAFVLHLMEGLRAVAESTGATLCVVYDTVSVDYALGSMQHEQANSISRHAFLQNWLGSCDFMAQADGDIGQRMEIAMAEAFKTGFERVVLLGSDIPDFPMKHVRLALDALRRDLKEEVAAVINPTEDGGYCLVALNAVAFSCFRSALFHDMPWSSAEVLPQTLSRFAEQSYQPYLLPMWYDIDTVEDLRKIEGKETFPKVAFPPQKK